MESHRTLWDSESKKRILRDDKCSQEQERRESGVRTRLASQNRVSHQTPWEECTTWARAGHNGFLTRPGWGGGGTLQAEKAFLKKAALRRGGVKACLFGGGLLYKGLEKGSRAQPERRSYSNTMVKSHKGRSTKENRRGWMTEAQNLV